MKKGIVVALAGVFSMVAVSSVVIAAEGPDGKITINQPEAVWGKAKSKTKAPQVGVSFNHKKHGADLGCVTCHHTEKDLKAGGTAKSCFTCHGAEAKDKQLTAKDIIHKDKVGKCINCHKNDEKAKAAKAPTKCKECHGGGDE
jgi:hypothetical protein